MTLRNSTLEGYALEMFDDKTKEKIEDFASMGKAARFCGMNTGMKFSRVVYQKKIVEVTHKGIKRNVFFKEKK
jgi:hypothetical protein